jgi:mRNA-degrading endonuclease RelE of RelBE toxin-antitoxin system
MPTWTRRAEKDLADLPPRMRVTAQSLCERLDTDITIGHKLQGKLKAYRSARLGRSHRIIYKVDNGVTIMTIRARKDAYR